MHNEISTPDRTSPSSDPRVQLFEAIASRRIVSVRYNGGTIRLAPHVLFERRGDLFLSALNLSKNRRPDDVLTLGQFKLAGLAETQLLEEVFEPLETDAKPPRPDDVLLLAV